MSENGNGEMGLETAYATLERVGKTGADRSRRRFEAIAGEAREQAETIRRLLAGPDGTED